MVAPLLTPAERAALAVEIKQLGDERVALEASMHDLEHACDEAQVEYDRYRDEIEQARLSR